MQINMIKRIAQSYHNTTGIEFDELLSEAAIGFAEAKETYDPKYGTKFSTWAWVYTCQRLNKYIKKQYKTEVSFEENQTGADDTRTSFFHLWDGFTEDAKTIAKMIFSAPSDFLSMAPKAARGKIYKNLRKQGWTWVRIWNSYKEIKKALNETA